MAENARLRRVTDLFVVGQEAVVDGKVLVWVNKPNAFERDEADKDGRYGRQRRLLPLRDPKDPADRTEELQLVYGAAEALTDEELVTGAVSQERSQQYLLTLDDLRADEDWADDIEFLERSDGLLADGSVMNEVESEAFTVLNQKYMAEIDRRFLERMETLEEQIRDEPRESLVVKYVTAWRQGVGLDAFEMERWRTSLFYALRECSAIQGENGRWDHGKCKHLRLLESREEVNALPDDFIAVVAPILTDLLTPPRAAGNLDAPTSSSESSAQQSEAEESTPSTQAAE